MASVSVVIPAFNEGAVVAQTVRTVRDCFASTQHECEVIVVDDGSSDDTGRQAAEAGARTIRHAMNIGYGNAILSGVRAASHPLIAITDADGTYPISELPAMVDELVKRDLDMLVGARQGRHYEGSTIKSLSRAAFKFLTEFTVGRRVPDINSGLRVMKRDMCLRYAPVLCGGFSFTTTITVVAMLTHHFVDYRPIVYHARVGKSKVRYFRDTLRAAQILVFTILLFNPIKLYLLLAGMALAALPLILVSLAFPQWAAFVLALCAAYWTSLLLLGLGFLAEQHTRTSALTYPVLGPRYSAVDPARIASITSQDSERQTSSN